ncbi:MAG: 6-bladed beta-propeller [Tannerellaceae bacterium]|nr:6-bladed beta-propeller [Tannerellaceae bacterium]
MTTVKTYLSFCLIIMLMGCKSNNGFSPAGDPTGQCRVVGTHVNTPAGEVISVDQSQLKETIQMPLSYLTESLEIVKLDDHDDALVGENQVVVSDNYILVWCHQQNPFKLFDKKGKYVCNIGSFGQGPGEYTMIYDALIDEKNNRIYLMPWMADKLLCYDLKGNPVEGIPLSFRTTKARMQVVPDPNKIIIASLPFPDFCPVVWVQDKQGNLLQAIEPGHLQVPWDFSNEMLAGRNTPDFDVNVLTIMPQARVDTLYHFDINNNRLVPKFTFNFMDDPISWHGYLELPDYFCGDVSYPEKIDELITVGQNAGHYIINKHTLRGGYASFINDY